MLTLNIASAIVFDKKNNLLILRRSNKNKHFIGYWQLPEGKIEENESSKDAVLRELKEELGFTPNSLKKLKKVSISLSIKSQKVKLNRTIYIARHIGNIRLSEDHSEYEWVVPNNIGGNHKLVPGTKKIIDLF